MRIATTSVRTGLAMTIMGGGSVGRALNERPYGKTSACLVCRKLAELPQAVVEGRLGERRVE